MGTCKWVLLILGLATKSDGYMGAVMGKLTTCDDAKTDLEVDWNPKDFSVFTCQSQEFYPIRKSIQPTIFDMVAINSSYNPRTDQVSHKCMNGELAYEDTIPVRGDHRPNWARFGEYLYVPVQRWLHNLEHGAIVMLYHPCADPNEVSYLRKIVAGCLYRHVITPYKKLSRDKVL
ncbi:hypothetical protein WR25_15970 [Diploscapter pachys]|uniref:DUF3105 domain-containing protein n=1 Tax=Diploscapter pachys TaxID=2018661 RepID=A0A2A2L328_9BILA|nr:hypothetical protein WR25_15970 [Diploscapter pachys]